MNDMIGHNAPDAAVAIQSDLTERYAEIAQRATQLIDAAQRVPDEIADDELAGKVGDFIKQVTACVKNAEAARVKEKEPHLAAGRSVDAWFKKITDSLDTTKRVIEKRLTAFLRVKEEAARREREKIAAEEREAARKAAEAAAAAERAIQNAKTLGEAIEAEDAARKALADAEASKKAAEVKAAELSRSRGDMGSVASLRTFMDFADLDRAALDLETLRSHLPLEALEKAVRSYIKAGGRELRGVRIFENTQAAVR